MKTTIRSLIAMFAMACLTSLSPAQETAPAGKLHTIWDWAIPGDSVSVLDGSDKAKATGDKGLWKVTLPKPGHMLVEEISREFLKQWDVDGKARIESRRAEEAKRALEIVERPKTLGHSVESLRTCRILFPNAPQLPEGRYFLFDGQNSHEVTLPRLSFSPVYKIRPGDIKIWLLTSPIGKPEELPPGSPEVTVTADARDIYLLISTDPDNRVLPMRVKVINANYEKIGLGEMLWINDTPKLLTGKIGKSSFHLAANATTLVKAPTSSHEDYPVEIYFRVPDDDRTHPLIGSQWNHDPRSRSVVFVYDEGQRRAPRVMSFSDFRMPEKEGEE